MACLRIFEDGVASMFTENEVDQGYIKQVLSVLSVYLIGDAIHGVNTGIVRALGKQFKASIATLICYYAIGMPLALVLGFKHGMGLVGFWVGFMIAMFLLDFVVIVIIVTADWEIATKTDETSLRLTRQNSFISVGSESATKNVLPMEPMLRLTRQSSYVSIGNSSANKRQGKSPFSMKKTPSPTPVSDFKIRINVDPRDDEFFAPPNFNINDENEH